ncbi:hypothetical protein ANTPLA_LOCUS5844 [Anthophora plagiata]
MTLLERYQELIERDAADISSLWKYLQMFLYLLSAISGYVCCVLFYIIWDHIFANKCPLWATSILMTKEEYEPLDINDFYMHHLNWWKYIIVHYKYTGTCYMYLTTCFLSCIFGVVWFTLFLMCGKGGHDVYIYEGPWRIVFPAMCFNSIFAIMSIAANYNLTEGYREFGGNMKHVAVEIYSTYKIVVDASDCEIIKTYIRIHNIHAHDMCGIMSYLQVFSKMMVYSWVGGSIMLFWRVITINDFRILDVKIYEVKTD